MSRSATVELAIATASLQSAPAPGSMSETEHIRLVNLLELAAANGYRFTTPTPLTHQRVLANSARRNGITLRDIAGWNVPFAENAIDPELFSAIDRAGVLQACGPLWRSTVRIASIDNDLFLHSAFPTVQNDAVFFVQIRTVSCVLSGTRCRRRCCNHVARSCVCSM